MIRLCDISITPLMYEKITAREIKIMINNKSSTYGTKAFSDKRKPEKSIFSLSRSSIENCLRDLTEELGFDLEGFPITPKTFLEQAHFGIGHRYVTSLKNQI